MLENCSIERKLDVIFQKLCHQYYLAVRLVPTRPMQLRRRDIRVTHSITNVRPAGPILYRRF